jgi:hypothetical protein
MYLLVVIGVCRGLEESCVELRMIALMASRKQNLITGNNITLQQLLS